MGGGGGGGGEQGHGEYFGAHSHSQSNQGGGIEPTQAELEDDLPSVREWLAENDTRPASASEVTSIHEGPVDEAMWSGRAARQMESMLADVGSVVDEPSVLDGLAARRSVGGGPHDLEDSGVARSVRDESADEATRPEWAARQIKGSVD